MQPPSCPPEHGQGPKPGLPAGRTRGRPRRTRSPPLLQKLRTKSLPNVIHQQIATPHPLPSEAGRLHVTPAAPYALSTHHRASGQKRDLPTPNMPEGHALSDEACPPYPLLPSGLVPSNGVDPPFPRIPKAAAIVGHTSSVLALATAESATTSGTLSIERSLDTFKTSECETCPGQATPSSFKDQRRRRRLSGFPYTQITMCHGAHQCLAKPTLHSTAPRTSLTNMPPHAIAGSSQNMSISQAAMVAQKCTPAREMLPTPKPTMPADIIPSISPRKEPAVPPHKTPPRLTLLYPGETARLRRSTSPNGSVGSPRSATFDECIFSPIDGTFETPQTSPEVSPTRPKPRRFMKLETVLHQVDGNGGSSLTKAAPEDIFGEETPLVPASPAKGAELESRPTRRSSGSHGRRPSMLLRHCERHASPRQRQLMFESVRSPDRFVPSRAATPTKDTLYLSKPAGPELSRRDDARAELADPFAPAPRRSIRMAEQYATLRAPAPLPREVGRRGTAVVPTVDAGRRAVSDGAIWTVGGTMVTEGVPSTTNGRGGRVTSGTSAPHHIADFLRKPSRSEEERMHRRRLALAMDVDQSSRMLLHSSQSSPLTDRGLHSHFSAGSRVWDNCQWNTSTPNTPTKRQAKPTREIPIIPFRVLDAPALRDDFYCSLLAYCPTIHCLAVGLGPHVYLWSEAKDKTKPAVPDSLAAPFASHVTSLSFSSRAGGSAILAIGRADGRITLWSPLDRDPRFDSEQPAPVSNVCFRPTTVTRPSIRDSILMAQTEELLVGDEVGNVYLYSVEWPNHDQRELFDWHGSMTLLARFTCHSQQIYGIAWSPDASFFATGGNDNQLFLFETKKTTPRHIASASPRRTRGDSDATVHVRSNTGTVQGQGAILTITPEQASKVYTLNAAVKAIAFAPWQPSLIAAGGGSNDRCIHFLHTLSGASLATIDCHAQVTSLMFSERKKEIAATFGFAQPEHPFRVAVFAWPSCRLVVVIPWFTEERALYAVAYPGHPAGRDRTAKTGNEGTVGHDGGRTRREGCLVVATSNASIKFHEIWADTPAAGDGGTLGGSSILEGMLDMERVPVIR